VCSESSNQVNKKTKIALATAIVLLLVAWGPWPATRGRLVARLDLARGNYEVLGYGLPVVWSTEYIQLLWVRYHIRYRTVALCIVSESLIAYADSYNRISTAAANRKYGHNVFAECAEEARRNWERTHSKAESVGHATDCAASSHGCQTYD
jgi:hypothetical protein